MLTAARIKNTKPKDRPFKMYDSHGLFLLVNPSGRMGWRYRYHFNNKEKSLSLGPFPLVSLKQARIQRDEMLLKVKNGIDPSAERKQARRQVALTESRDRNTFQYVALQYLLKQAGCPPGLKNKSVTELQAEFDRRVQEQIATSPTKGRGGTLQTSHRRLEMYIFPHIANQQIRDVTGPQLLALIRRIESRGTIETARRTLAICRRVCRFAVSQGKADFDAAGSIDARESLVPAKTRHFPAITDPREIGALMRALHGYQGQPVTEAALKLMPLVFVRPGELRAAEWSEFDLERGEWRIPAKRMKMRKEHIVPLAI